MNRYIPIIIILIICLLLTGCGSYKEIDSFYIVAGMGVDKVPGSNQYKITIELVNIMENREDKSFESLLLEAEGDSVFDAVSKMIRISAKRPNWAHATSVIISEDAAREGIAPFIDLISRNEDGRLSMNIFISRGRTAKEILQMKSFSTDIRSFELEIMVNESNNLVKVPVVNTNELINALSIPKVHSVLPTVVSFNNNGTDTIQLSGGAIFADGKLVF